MTHVLVPHMLERFEKNGKRSAIVNICSTSALDFAPKLSVYAATKTFNHVFSSGLRQDYSYAFDVLTVTPRSVRTNMNSGIYLFTIEASDHAKGVFDKLGHEPETYGHWKHHFQSSLLGFGPTAYLMHKVDDSRREAFIQRNK